MSRALLTLLLVSLAGCAHQPADPEAPAAGSLRPEGLGLTSGTSFGLCAGYCRTELALDSPTVSFTESANPAVSALAPRTRSLTLTPAEWQRIRSAVDLAALARLEGVHGCPDCADGGAEWIRVERPDSLRVTFDYGAVLQPIAALQAELRALRARFPR